MAFVDDIFDRMAGGLGSRTFLRGLIRGITYDLSNCRLHERLNEAISDIFPAIPQATTSLDLSHNDLNRCSVSKLMTCFAAIPPHITTLILSNNNLHNKTEAEWYEILSKIPNSLTNIISNPTIPILKKIQRNVFEQLTAAPDLIPELAEVVMGYAVETPHFKYQEKERSPKVQKSLAVNSGLFWRIKNYLEHKSNPQTKPLSESKVVLR